MIKAVARGTALAALSIAAAQAASPTLEELSAIVSAQQDQIDALQREASGPSRTHIGGYGELHANLVSGGADEIDFHRFVLFFGHDFNDRLRFRSEFELEHALAGDDKPGEVELEQAYIEYDVAPGSTARGGVLLVPVGILNETHEPPTFYGVERNRVENRIIPATWWEAGAAYSKSFADSGLSYDVMLHSGLMVDITKGSPIRSGRQKVAEATANDWAATGRVRYNGIAGLQLAASLQYQNDITQDDTDNVDAATLFTTHAILNRGIFGARALFAQWDIDGDGAKTEGKDRLRGWYVEPSIRPNQHWGAFVRYSSVELVRDSEETNWVAGVNFWPHENVVLKADYSRRENPDDSTGRAVNLGIGYQF